MRPGSGHHVERLVHEAQEVPAQPTDANELCPVRALVKGQPQAKLPGGEAVAALQDGDVGPHVVHHVLVVGLVVLDDQQVVLAEHTGGHPPQQRAHLGAAHHAGDLTHGPRPVTVVGHAVGEGTQQPLERRHVGADPRLTVHHHRPCLARHLEAGGLCDEALSLLGGLFEVPADGADHRRSEVGLGAALGRKHPAGQIPSTASSRRVLISGRLPGGRRRAGAPRGARQAAHSTPVLARGGSADRAHLK